MVFGYQNFPEIKNTESAPSAIFSHETKKFSTSFCDTPLYGSLKTDKWAALENSRDNKNFQKTKRAPWLIFRYCETVKQKALEIFWWYPAMVHQEYCAKEKSKVDFDVFSACVSFRLQVFDKENSQFSCVVFFCFSIISEIHANFLLQTYWPLL